MDYPKSVPNVGLVNGKFVDENTTAGVVGSLIPSEWGNAVTDEILNVIAEAGLSPAEEDLGQLTKAIKQIVQNGAPAAASESVAGIAKVATQMQTNAGTDDTKFITPKKFLAALSSLVVQATESVMGIAKVATQAQTAAGTDDATFVTPKKLAAAIANVVSQATETALGVVRLASVSDANAGTDTQKAVTPAGVAAARKDIGFNQSWQDVKASRALNTTYTNSTGRTIAVYVTAQSSSSIDTYGGLTGMVNGAAITANTVTSRGSVLQVGVTLIVPPGATYAVQPGVNGSFVAVTLVNWQELRA